MAGRPWAKPADVSNTPGASSEPDVKIAKDGTIVVVWLDTSAGGDSPDVWATASHDAGKTWDKPQNVSNTPGKSMTPSIAVGSDNSADVVWTDTTAGDASPDVYFSRSTDGGKTWSAALDVSNTPGSSSDCDVAVDDKNNIFVAWADTSEGAKSPDIMVAASKRRRQDVLEVGERLEHPGRVERSRHHRLGQRQGRGRLGRHLGRAPPARDVWMASSGDGAKKFGKGTNISNTPGVSKEPDVAIAKGKVFVVWQEDEGAKSKVKLVAAPAP